MIPLALIAQTAPSVADALPGLPPWAQVLVASVVLPLVAALLHDRASMRRVVRAFAKTALELSEDPQDAATLERHAESEGVSDHPEIKRATAVMQVSKVEDEPKKS